MPLIIHADPPRTHSRQISSAEYIDLELIVVLRCLRNASLPLPVFPETFRSSRYYRDVDGEYDLLTVPFLGPRIPASRRRLLSVLSGSTMDYGKLQSDKSLAREQTKLLLEIWRPAVFSYASMPGALPYPASGKAFDIDSWLADVDERTGVTSSVAAVMGGVPLEDVLA